MAKTVHSPNCEAAKYPSSGLKDEQIHEAANVLKAKQFTCQSACDLLRY